MIRLLSVLFALTLSGCITTDYVGKTYTATAEEKKELRGLLITRLIADAHTGVQGGAGTRSALRPPLPLYLGRIFRLSPETDG